MRKSIWSLSLLMVGLLVACESKQGEQVKKTEPVVEATKEEATPAAKEEAPAATDNAEEKKSEEELAKAIEESRKYGHIPIAGETTREAVLEKFGTWRAKMGEVEASQEVAEKFAAVKPGAEVTVIFGTWCSDCYNTLPVLWKHFDMVGGDLPFKVNYIALDERFTANGVDLTPYDVHSIPTIIVKRDDKEVGRFIEQNGNPPAEEVLALLNGSKTGILSTNPKIVKRYGLDQKK